MRLSSPSRPGRAGIDSGLAKSPGRNRRALSPAYDRLMTQRAPRTDVPDTPRPPVPPDKGRQDPVEEPPGQPGAPPADPATPPEGDPIPPQPTRLV
jgi:hypothetical protein